MLATSRCTTIIGGPVHLLLNFCSRCTFLALRRKAEIFAAMAASSRRVVPSFLGLCGIRTTLANRTSGAKLSLLDGFGSMPA